MARFLKLITLAGLSSVYLMQPACSYGGHGWSMLPNGLLPLGSLSSLFSSLTGGLLT